jgi:hypothetical protein
MAADRDPAPIPCVRRGELAEAAALRQHERLTEVKVRPLGDRVSRRVAWEIAGSGLGFDARRRVPRGHPAAGRVYVTGDAEARARADGVVPLGTLDQLSRQPLSRRPSSRGR